MGLARISWLLSYWITLC